MKEKEFYCPLSEGICESTAHQIPHCHVCKFIGNETDEEPCKSCESWSNFEMAYNGLLTGRIGAEKFGKQS